MPRIDPLQLLKCLSVLLSQEGGILSRDEVPRLVNLMTKFSKKLVSKCVYVLILKNTETSLVDMFMAEGGWTLIQTWLQDAAQSGNWDLVKEILGLLLVTPVDVERLKMNCLPKLIKNLSRREDLEGVAQLSNQIVQNWLVIVKGSAHGASAPAPIQTSLEKREIDSEPVDVVKDNEVVQPEADHKEVIATEEQDGKKDSDSDENSQAINTSTFYKSTVKENKQITRKISTEDDKLTTDKVEEETKNDKIDDNKINEKESKLSEKDKEKSTKSSSSSRSKSKSSSSRDKDRDKDRKRSSHSSSSRSKSSSSSSKDKDRDRRDKDRDRKDKDKDRSKHHSSSKSSSSKSSSKDKSDSKDKSKSSDSKDSKYLKETIEKQAEKDKDTLQKLKPQTLDKLGRIPKKSNSSSDDKQKENKTENKPKDVSEKELSKKPSFSILNRKASGEERSKTVKVFNSKMRSTGLEEEVKPPPPRSAKKPTPSVQLPTIPPKRPSPPREPSIMPPEKKLKIDKIDLPERPGAIKLIPPKPKPVLQESDMFMDALTASAPKKEAKKRKRRPSVTKDTPSSPSSSPAGGDPPTPTSPTPSSQSTTPLGLKNIAPFNFYQDTLSEEPQNDDESKTENSNEENKESTEKEISLPENNDTPASPIANNDAELVVENEGEPSPPKIIKTDGLKGVLLHTKKKGPKRSIKWKAEEDLVDIRYFELDETERVNVTKTFMDMAKMDITSEREALIMSRKTASEDLMEPQTMWRMLYVCDQPDNLAVPGSKSLEKDIQFAREKSVLPALYFDKRRIPDSPEEPIPEIHQMSDPVIIPLEDPESQEIDLRSTPWPDPKGLPPQLEPQPMPPMFPNMPFNPNFNNMGNMPPGPQFVGVPPRFPGPAGPIGPMGPGPGVFGPPNMMHNNMMGPPINQQEMMNQGPVNPGMYGPGPDGFIGPGNEQNFPMQQFNGPQGPNMNMYGPNNFNHRGSGDGDNRGGYRRGGGNNGGWVRMNGPRNNWKRGRGGGGSRGGRMCKNIQNHGYCRNRENCPFLH